MLMDHGQGMGGGLGGVVGSGNGVGGGGGGAGAGSAYAAHQQMAAQMSQLQPPMMNGVGGGMPMAAQVRFLISWTLPFFFRIKSSITF